MFRNSDQSVADNGQISARSLRVIQSGYCTRRLSGCDQQETLARNY